MGATRSLSLVERVSRHTHGPAIVAGGSAILVAVVLVQRPDAVVAVSERRAGSREAGTPRTTG